MAERKRQKKKKEEVESPEDEKPSKEEYAIAKYIKNTLPPKKTSLLGHKVEYFIASKAVDCLLDSDWASGKNKATILFTDRESIETYLDIMLTHKFFHRAKKIVPKDQKKKGKKDEDTADEKKTSKKDDDKSGKEDEKKTSKDDDKKSGKEDDKEVEGDKKKKRKIKLDMHLDQIFVDGNDAYVWIFDPIPLKTWVIGALIVFGSIALCLFPLWPATIRLGVYYLSLLAAGFLVFLLGLAVVRLIIFVIIWVVTMGRHHLWLLPNLMEDVGFFESFWPLYYYEYRGVESSEDEKSVKKNKNEKDYGESEKLIKDDDENKNDEGDVKKGSDATKDSASDRNTDEDRADNGFEVLDSADVSGSEKKE